MSAYESLEQVLSTFQGIDLRGFHLQLGLEGFDAVAYLSQLELVASRLAGQSKVLNTDMAVDVNAHNLLILGQRMLLGRQPEMLQRLRNYWNVNGKPNHIVQEAIEAVESALAHWPGTGASADSADQNFSGAHSEFVGQLARIEHADQHGPLGQGLRESRYSVGLPARSTAWLPGEKTRPVGFPIVLGAKANVFRSSAWVEPIPNGRKPDWMALLDQVPAVLPAPVRDNWQNTMSQWQKVCRDVSKLLSLKESTPWPSLPAWLTLYAACYGTSDLSSAGLSLAMQVLADQENWPLPAGVGFTGGWDARGLLAPVSGIARKLQAAREAGVFALFACYHDQEAPADADVKDGGVDLFRLPPELDLKDVVRLVNTACAARGLTEDRWQWQSKKLAATLGSQGRIASLPLPEAANPEANPVNFPFGHLERTQLKEDLCVWKQSTEPTNGPRQIRALIGKARSGKTTLLSDWLTNDKDAWPRFPVWFSFLRNPRGADRTGDLQEALENQLRARYAVALPQEESDQPGQRRAENLSESEKRIQRLCRFTGARIDIVVDGLDEAYHGDEPDILKTLRGLLDRATVLIGTQPGSPAVENIDTSLKLDLDRRPNRLQEDAEQLIRNAAQVFKNSDDPCLEKIGNTLDDPSWQKRLAERAHGNLWQLTDFLRSHLENPDASPWPDSPEETPLTGDVRQYCRIVFDETIGAYENGSERDQVTAFVTYLAILESRFWSIDEVLYFRGQTPIPVDRARCQRLLTERMHRFLSFDKQHVRFRDGTFQDYLSETHPLDRETVAQRLLDLLKSGPIQAAGSSELREYAVASAARHVLREERPDPNLAAKLVLETEWGPARLQFLAEEGKPVNDFLGDLAALRSLVEGVRPNAVPCVESLSRALATWGWAIDQSRSQVRSWWQNLADLQADSTWSKLQTEWHPRRASLPCLLIPSGRLGTALKGYSIPAKIPDLLAGPACEMPNTSRSRPSLVFATNTGCLLIYDYNTATGAYDTQRIIPLALEGIQELLSTGPSEITLQVDDGWHAVYKVLKVNVDSGTWETLPVPGQPLAIGAAGNVAHPSSILVATADDSSSELRLLRDGVGQGDGLLLPFRAGQVTRFAPMAWAVRGASGGPSYHSSTDELRIVNEREQGLHDATAPALTEAVEGMRILSVCAVSACRLAILVQSRIQSKIAEVLLISHEGELLDRIDLEATRFEQLALAWHERLRLLVTSGGQDWWALELDPLRTSPQLPKRIVERITIPEESGTCLQRAVTLSDGSLLLIVSTGAFLIAPDAGAVVQVGRPKRCLAQNRIVGCRGDGWVRVCREQWYDHQAGNEAECWVSPPSPCSLKEVEEGFKRITADGKCVYLRDNTVWAKAEVDDQPILICAAAKLREFLSVDASTQVKVHDAIQDPDRGWLVAALVGGEEKPRHQGFGGSRPRYSLSILLQMSETCRVVHQRPDLQEDEVCRLESCAGGLLAFSLVHPNGDCSTELLEVDSGMLIFVDEDRQLPEREDTELVGEESPTSFRIDPNVQLVRIARDCCLFSAWVDRSGGRRRPIETLFLYQTAEGESVLETLEEVQIRTGIQVLDPSGDKDNNVVRIGFVKQQQIHSECLQIYDFRPGETDHRWDRASIELGDEEATCCAVVDQDRLAVGYRSKRIEVISVGESRRTGKKVVVAVGFTLTHPTDMVLSRSTQGTYLVVAAEDFLWFELAW